MLAQDDEFHIVLMIFGRTDLRKGVSKAKFDEEADFEVRSAEAPQKSCEKAKNKIDAETFRFRKFRIERSVFRVVFEQLRPNGPQNQLPRQILL